MAALATVANRGRRLCPPARLSVHASHGGGGHHSRGCVVDAVDAAGGPTALADVDVINLAAALFDAAQVFVPRRGSVGTRAPIPRPLPGVNAPPSPNANTPEGASSVRVNINTASMSDLDTLSGVGPSTAKAIIDYRTKNGPFGSIEDLLNVRGIGPAKLDAMREQVTV